MRLNHTRAQNADPNLSLAYSNRFLGGQRESNNRRGETSLKLLHHRNNLKFSEVPSSQESSFVSFVLREELLIGE